MAPLDPSKLLFDFPDATALARWEVVNGGVMGGIKSG